MTQSAPAPPAQDDAAPERPLLARLNARGFRLLMLVDALAVGLALVVPMLVRHGLTWPTYSSAAYAGGYAAIVALHMAAFYFGGLYEREQRLGHRSFLPRASGAVLGSILLVALAELLTGVFLVPRGNLAAVAVLAALGVTANRGLSRWLRDRRDGPPRVFLVGAPDDVNLARAHLAETEERAEVVGSANSSDGLLEAVLGTEATDVLVLTSRLLDELHPEPLSSFDERGIGVLQRVGARDTLLGLRAVREVAGMPFVPVRTRALPQSRWHAKRTLELLVLALLLPVALPLVALVALYVLAVAGRPVLFRQERVGKDGAVFSMVKFRTMVRDAERHGGAQLAARGRDPRVVRGLGWLRATRLDELPQLWNVLRGEMSIVGPRPERPELTHHFAEMIPGYTRRHEVPPGLTGLAQIHGRYHTDAEYKLGHDLQYLVNWSPVLDLVILAKTFWVVVTRRL
ncbi:exopolysaccharide biosynthesis polyprenyl glycosylphosphotransferase [Egibacter rhizosphaerae]|uniref:Exopolysaccharide biosynthesis polyprenyl glycosylphosphotransferase n=1 Tax=Egibacter rhizosphaerae TaxID=1670831 RepID=A0A411YJX8_9ACTN|nr:exopolysaccharide biosynthesis polyprenyl glycosylphosphotransferase [Egibacter rhizosphaerae]QBI21493.1 exopolysaccharide biosynthesis polyprenyl glycosylphosphotransferase [Egibacter rhizosphaerae]